MISIVCGIKLVFSLLNYKDDARSHKHNTYIYFIHTLHTAIHTYTENFDVLLTVHLSIFISVINQLDAHNFCFTISLFLASTCFEHMCLKHVEARNKLTVKQKFCASSWLITEINTLKSHSTDLKLVNCKGSYIQHLLSESNLYFAHTVHLCVSYDYQNKDVL